MATLRLKSHNRGHPVRQLKDGEEYVVFHPWNKKNSKSYRVPKEGVDAEILRETGITEKALDYIKWWYSPYESQIYVRDNNMVCEGYISDSFKIDQSEDKNLFRIGEETIFDVKNNEDDNWVFDMRKLNNETIYNARSHHCDATIANSYGDNTQMLEVGYSEPVNRCISKLHKVGEK